MYKKFSKSIIILIITAVSYAPLFSFQILNLDFSGLKSLSELGDKLNKLPKYKIKNDLDFATVSKEKKFTLKEAYEKCDSLCINGESVWYLPTLKDMLTLSSNQAVNTENNISVYIKKEYLRLLPKVDNAEKLTFWTSNITIEAGYELGEIVSFAYSFDELENAPLDLSSDKKDKHFVLCKRADDTINIKWGEKNFISIYGNNFRLSKELRFIGSIDLDDKTPKIIDYKNSQAYFPLKNFLLILYKEDTLYILDLEKRRMVSKIDLKMLKHLYLKEIKKAIKSNKNKRI